MKVFSKQISGQSINAIYLFIYLFIYVFIYLSIYLFIYLFFNFLFKIYYPIASMGRFVYLPYMKTHKNQPNVRTVNIPYMDGMGIEYKYINLYTIKQPRTSRGYTSQQPFDFHPSLNLGNRKCGGSKRPLPSDRPPTRLCG